MKVGDRVQWTSQSQSFLTTKRGEIICIVPSAVDPTECLPPGFKCNSTTGYGSPRAQISYLVKVDGKGNRLYWPVADKLKLIK